MAPGKRKRKPPRSHTVAKVVGVTVLVLGLMTGVALTYAYTRLNGNVKHTDFTSQLTNRPEALEFDGPKKPINILVMGSDSREGDNNIDNVTDMGTHSDTTILFHLSADRQRAYGISIPRDSIVERPDCTLEDGTVVPGYAEAMWNEAFNKAGPACTIQQFEQLTGVRVDHSVVVDFSGFIDMVNAVGGVEVCVPEEIDDREYGIHLPAGTYTVKDRQALAYVRERHGVGDGSDIGRMKRQQYFLASLAHKVLSADTLSNPVKLFNFLDAATKSLEVDEEMGNLKDMAALGYQFRQIGLDQVRFVTLPWEAYPSDPNRVQWAPEADDVWQLVKEDQPLPRKLSAEAATAGKPNKAGGNGSGSSTGLCT